MRTAASASARGTAEPARAAAGRAVLREAQHAQRFEAAREVRHLAAERRRRELLQRRLQRLHRLRARVEILREPASAAATSALKLASSWLTQRDARRQQPQPQILAQEILLRRREQRRRRTVRRLRCARAAACRPTRRAGTAATPARRPAAARRPRGGGSRSSIASGSVADGGDRLVELEAQARSTSTNGTAFSRSMSRGERAAQRHELRPIEALQLGVGELQRGRAPTARCRRAAAAGSRPAAPARSRSARSRRATARGRGRAPRAPPAAPAIRRCASRAASILRLRVAQLGRQVASAPCRSPASSPRRSASRCATSVRSRLLRAAAVEPHRRPPRRWRAPQRPRRRLATRRTASRTRAWRGAATRRVAARRSRSARRPAAEVDGIGHERQRRMRAIDSSRGPPRGWPRRRAALAMAPRASATLASPDASRAASSPRSVRHRRSRDRCRTRGVRARRIALPQIRCAVTVARPRCRRRRSPAIGFATGRAHRRARAPHPQLRGRGCRAAPRARTTPRGAAQLAIRRRAPPAARRARAARAETARYRQLVVDLENNAPPPLLGGPARPTTSS